MSKKTPPKKDPKLNAAAALGDALDDAGAVGGSAAAVPADVDESIKMNRLQASTIELAKMSGEVVPVENVQEALRMLVGEVVNELHTLGDNIGPKLARIKNPAKCRDAINAKVDEVLARLNKFDVQEIANAAADQTRNQKYRSRLARQ